MPNHVINKIELLGDNSDIEKLKAHMIGESYDDGTPKLFDFGKIVPMSDELNITSDGWLALLENPFSWNEPLKDNLDRERARPNFEYSEHIENSIDNFAQGIKNYLKYGFCCWYDWSVENWGTKWNAYSINEWENNTITFETAWAGVPVLIKKLSKMFPNIEIRYYFSDEDTGCNCGFGRYKDGELDFKKLENNSIEAYDLAFELRPQYRENYELIDGSYQHKDEDE